MWRIAGLCLIFFVLGIGVGAFLFPAQREFLSPDLRLAKEKAPLPSETKVSPPPAYSNFVRKTAAKKKALGRH